MHFEQTDHNFTFRFFSNDDNRTVELNCNELYIGDIFERFKEFLQGCGYPIDGYIDVIPYEKPHYDKFDFDNIPNNNWPFGTKPIETLTTQEISSVNDWSRSGGYQAAISPLTAEQISPLYKSELPLSSAPAAMAQQSTTSYAWDPINTPTNNRSQVPVSGK